MKKRIIIACLLLLVFTAVVVPTPQTVEEQKFASKKTRKLFEKAMKTFQEKKIDEAIELLQQVVPLEPENAMVRHNIGVMLHQKGKVDESIASFEEALRLNPHYEHAQLAMRQALFEAGREASANKNFEKANQYLLKLRDLPFFAGKNDNMLIMARYILGFNFFNLKQYPQSQANFEWCIALEGMEMENLDIYANSTYFLGMINTIKKQYDDAIYYFKKYLLLFEAMEKKPELYAQASYLIGSNLFQKLEAKVSKGEMAGVTEASNEIIPYLEKAITDKIPSEDPFVMLGNCYIYRSEIGKAIQTYEKLIEIFPQSPQLQNYKTFIGELQKNQPKEKIKKKK